MSTYLITGGTGTLGTSLTLHLLDEGHKVRTYSRNEHSIERLIARVPDIKRERLSTLVGAIEDPLRLKRACHGVETLIHAAAQKVIPLAEYDPASCVRTNVQGTMNVIDASIDCGVSHAVLVSSDKARAPSTLYGATKLCAERLWLAANRYLGSAPGVFSAVAYGNVWDSQGSVIRSFLSSSASRGAISVTDPSMTRFHLTLSSAVSFVLRASREAKPGTLWVPKLPSYRLGDLAEAFVTLRPDCRIERTGRRIAEKLHEELITENESPTLKEEDPDHYVLEPGSIHQEGGWSYQSGSNTLRLSKEALIEAINLAFARASQEQIL